jgi:hypothetical protein
MGSRRCRTLFEARGGPIPSPDRKRCARQMIANATLISREPIRPPMAPATAALPTDVLMQTSTDSSPEKRDAGNATPGNATLGAISQAPVQSSGPQTTMGSTRDVLQRVKTWRASRQRDENPTTRIQPPRPPRPPR